MKSATKGAWRSIRWFLLIACAGGVLAADNTWVSAVNLTFAKPTSWFSSVDDSPDTLAVFDYSGDARSPRQVSMDRLLDSLLFYRPSGGSMLARSAGNFNPSSILANQPVIANEWSGDRFLETRSESTVWARGPVSGGAGESPVTINATAGSWIGNNPGTQNWSTASNWAGGIIADGSGAVATITFDITGPRNVHLDISRMIGSLVIGDANGSHSYTLTAAAGQQLIFDNGSLNTSITQTATSAGDTISAPILLLNSIDISNASANPLTISGPISSGVGVATSPAAVGSPHGIESETGDIIISGSISDGGGSIYINKGGTGTLTLSGTNSYSGNTNAFGGTLLIDGDNSAATGNVFVSGNGTLGGIGTIGADVYVGDGGTITGGTTTGVGTLTMNNLYFLAEVSGGIYLANLSGALSDTLAVINQLNLDGSDDTISITGTGDGTTTYVLATFDSRIGTFNSEVGVPADYDLVYTDHQILLVPIPEPPTWIGGALALAALSLAQYRRRARRGAVS